MVVAPITETWLTSSTPSPITASALTWQNGPDAHAFADLSALLHDGGRMD